MSTTTSGPQASEAIRDDGSEDRILLRGVDRALFDRIVAARGDSSVPRLTWIDGDLELMSPSYRHEKLADRLADLVKIVARALGVPFEPAGTTTLRRDDPGRSKEPDASFYLAHAAAVAEVEEIDLGIHPPPDLVIEVEIRNPLRHGAEVSADLGVPELWRCDGRELRFFHLGADGQYEERSHSRSLPRLSSAEAMGLIVRGRGMPYGQWLDEVERWAREELANRPA
ncbi:Uma2 family endonuclease [Tautonia sociabilis]|nr:Uma2 family endonuclease [Tautonia sociabilis]